MVKAVMRNLLLLFLGACAGGLIVQAKSEREVAGLTATIKKLKESGPQQKTDNTKLIVYYFHADKRCDACNRVEKFTKEALDKYYAKELSSGEIIWNVLNRKSVSNKALAEKYELIGNKVILQKMDNGKSGESINLGGIWEKNNHEFPNLFHEYIHKEIEAFTGMKGTE